MELALDLALQMSPDHPWLEEHPEWFQHRPDGSLKYAENPPKRYQDIHNVDWETRHRKGLWNAIRDVVLHWCDAGVTVFRVDNPHTKPVPFWEWLIAQVRKRHPGTVFLSEAFTRPAMMTLLAKAGFSQSLHVLHVEEHEGRARRARRAAARVVSLPAPEPLAEHAGHPPCVPAAGGRPAFECRLVLAATLSPSYGIYSGYEACENVPVREGSEEYLDSEKYEVRDRRLDGPLLPLIRRLNQVAPRASRPDRSRPRAADVARDRERAPARLRAGLGDDAVLVVVNLDPYAVHDGVCVAPTGPRPGERVPVVDALAGEAYDWGARNYVRLGPGQPRAEVQRP